MKNNHDDADQTAIQHLPNGAKLSWGLAKQPRRGPKGELSVPQIVQAAITIADKDGLAAVSMNRVAAALGFTTMSLYRYISSKDDLLFLMQDAVCETVMPAELEHADDWREEMRAYVRECMRLMRLHPWYGDIPVSGIPLGPHNLKLIDWALRPMRNFPLNDFEKMSIVLLLSTYARMFAMISRDLDRAIEAGASPDSISGMNYTAALQHLVKPESFPYLYPLIASGAYTNENESDNTIGSDIDFGLERILDGIEHYLTRRGSRR